MMVLEDADLHTLGCAFDRAWQRFLATGMLTPENAPRARELIARRILESAQTGEHDEWRLARDALFNLWELEFAGTPLPVLRRARSQRNKRSFGRPLRASAGAQHGRP